MNRLTVTYQVEIIHFFFFKLKKFFLVVLSCMRNLNSLTRAPLLDLRVLTSGPPGMSPVLFILYYTVGKGLLGYTEFKLGYSDFRVPALNYLEKAMTPHSSTLAWKIPGMAEPGGLPSMGLHRVGHD